MLTDPRTGDTVCDCWYTHQAIRYIHADGRITLANGRTCTPGCLNPADHPEHGNEPEDAALECVTTVFRRTRR